jgi:microtubule-associated protein-like 6
LFTVAKVAEGDQRLAVLPFKGQVDASWPTGFEKTIDGATEPHGNLTIDYVHGYRGFDMRDSVKYADDSNEIVYTAAGLGIVLKKDENEQRFFNQHKEDIVSMDIHPGRNIVATGQMAAKGKAKLIDLFVWDSDDCTIIQKLCGFHRRAINVIKFSPNGKYLLSVGEDDMHSVAIYEWSIGRLVSTAKCGGYKMLTASWKNDMEFVVAGVREVKFFDFSGSKLDGKKGIFGPVGCKPICSAAYAYGDKLVTGTSKGVCLTWSGRIASSKVLKLSKESGQIWSIYATKNKLIIGDSSGTIYFLDKSFKVTDKIVVNSDFNTQIRSLDYLEDKKTLLIGTRACEIYEYEDKKFTCLMRGHFHDEVWGAA